MEPEGFPEAPLKNLSSEAEALLDRSVEGLNTPSPVKQHQRGRGAGDTADGIKGTSARAEAASHEAEGTIATVSSAGDSGDRSRGEGAESMVRVARDGSPAAGAAEMAGSATFVEMGEGERLRVLEEEWRNVQAVHDSVTQLKIDLELGKLPHEPAERRAFVARKMDALQNKLEAVQGEARVLRENCKEAYRLKAAAEVALDKMDVEYGQLLEASEARRRDTEGRVQMLEEKCREQGAKLEAEAEREAKRDAEAEEREAELQIRMGALERMVEEQGEALQSQQAVVLEQRSRAELLEGELADARMSRDAASASIGGASLSLRHMEDAARDEARGRQMVEMAERMNSAVKRAEEAEAELSRLAGSLEKERERSDDLAGKLREEGKVRSFQARRVAKLEADMKALRSEGKRLVEEVDSERARTALATMQLEKLRAARPRNTSPRKLPMPANASFDVGGGRRSGASGLSGGGGGGGGGEDVGRLKEEVARLREEVVTLKGRLDRSKRQIEANKASMELWSSMGGEVAGAGDWSLNVSSSSSARGVARGGRATAVALSANEDETERLRSKVSGLSSDVARLREQLEQTEREKSKLEQRIERAESDRSELTLLLRSMDEERRCLESKLEASEEISKKSQSTPSHLTYLPHRGVGAADDGGKEEAQRRAVMAEEKFLEANERGEMAEEKMREAEGKARDAEENARKAEEKAREAEKGLREAEEKATEREKKVKDALDEMLKAREAQREAEEKCIVLEEQLRPAKDDLRRALADKAKGDQIRGEIERRQMETEMVVREVSQKLEIETKRCSALEEQLADAEKQNSNLAVKVRESQHIGNSASQQLEKADKKNAALIVQLESAERRATTLEETLRNQILDSEGRMLLVSSEMAGLRKSAKQAAEKVLSFNESAKSSEALGTRLQKEIDGLGNILSEVEKFLCDALRSVPHASIELTKGPRTRSGWQADIRHNLQRGISVLADMGDKSGAAASHKRVFVAESVAASEGVESPDPHSLVTSPRLSEVNSAFNVSEYQMSSASESGMPTRRLTKSGSVDSFGLQEENVPEAQFSATSELDPTGQVLTSSSSTSEEKRAPSIFAQSRTASNETSKQFEGTKHRGEESLALPSEGDSHGDMIRLGSGGQASLTAVNAAFPSVMPTLRPGASRSLDEDEGEIIARQKILNARLFKARDEAEERHRMEREEEMNLLQQVGLRQNSMSPERGLGLLVDVAAQDATKLETKALSAMARKMIQEKEIERINEIEGLNMEIEKSKSFSTLSELNKAIAATATLAHASKFSSPRERRPIREMFKDLQSKRSAALKSGPDLFRGHNLNTVPGVRTNDSDESTPECSPAKMQKAKQRANSQGDVGQVGGLPKDGPVKEAIEADKEMPSSTDSSSRSQSSKSAESGNAISGGFPRRCPTVPGVISGSAAGEEGWVMHKDPPEQNRSHSEPINMLSGVISGSAAGEEGWVMHKDPPEQNRSHSEPINKLAAAGRTGQNESAAPLSAAQMEEGWLLAQSHPTREGLDHSRQRQGPGASTQAQKPPSQAITRSASNDPASPQDSLGISDVETDISASSVDDSFDDGERAMRTSRGAGGGAGSLPDLRHNMQRRFVWN